MQTYGKGGYVAGSTKQELQDRARKLGIRGRTTMSKEEFGRAIRKKQ